MHPKHQNLVERRLVNTITTDVCLNDTADIQVRDTADMPSSEIHSCHVQGLLEIKDTHRP